MTAISQASYTVDVEAGTPFDKIETGERHVDVEDAKAEFSALEKKLTQTAASHRKVEDEEDAAGQYFDLRDWLTGLSNTTEEMGIKKKAIGVSWQDLEVIGAASSDLTVPTIPSMAVQELVAPVVGLLSLVGVKFHKGRTRKLLEGFTGSAKPGEMVLVLGRPGAGCSTFLKAILGKNEGFVEVEGQIDYGGIEAKEMHSRYAGQMLYCEEDDIHYPTLTVAQTLDFALRLKSGSQTLPGYTHKQMRDMVRDTMMDMASIRHTENTRVGNATVRGVSGGERKRLSILEILASDSPVISWDNSSRGLDASTALDFAKSLRILCDIMKVTMFVSLYQASDSIFEQFDKVMVIDQGRCIFYGPRQEARQYFHGLGFADRPRQTSADYITGMTDRHERIFQRGRSEKNVPCTPQELERAYHGSEIRARVLSEKVAYDRNALKERNVEMEDFRAAVQEEKSKVVRAKSKYNKSIFQQIGALLIRQMQIKLGDMFDINVSYITTIILALLMGGIFFNMPTTSNGLFVRGSCLFTLLLFNALSAFAELPTQMEGMPILVRQAGFLFFRPSAQVFAQQIADLPIGIPRSTLFVIIVYFMSGLHRSAGAFFTAWLIITASYYAFRALFGFFGTISKTYHMAARLAVVIFVLLTMWAGYVIPMAKMAKWLYWICYLNPVYFAFEALMINEFKRIDCKCAAEAIVPSGPGYPLGLEANQACTMPGSTPGSDLVPGLSFLKQAYGFTQDRLWLDVGILFIFIAGYIGITALVIELGEAPGFTSAMTVRKPPSKEEQVLNAALLDRSNQEGAGLKLGFEGQAFIWSNLQYRVPIKGGEKTLLNNIDGFVKPGTMTALMGSSGAGKTTLLDVLADRKTTGVINGDRLIAGMKMDDTFRRQCGYAEQQDIHEPMCTVREALRFSAYLRQPYEVSRAEKDEYVENIIGLLELQDLADAIIGEPGLGLGVGDRKRVTIAVELAAKPSMLLFLDEPTSGLDGQSAFTICRLLRKLADSGQTILCTIHQPSALLFETFDRLLLLQRGGNVAYFGPIGKDGQHVIDYFGKRGAHCPPGANPAEFMLEAIGVGQRKPVGNRDWSKLFLESDLHRSNLVEIQSINETEAMPAPLVAAGNVHNGPYAAPWYEQFRVVLKRTMLSSWRQPEYQYTRLLQHICFALLAGLLMLHLDNSVASLQYRVFAIFVLAIIPAVIMSQIQPYWIVARSTWIREETSKTFSGYIFAATQLISEVPYALACATAYFLLIYYMVGFNPDSGRAAFFWAVTLFTELFAITIGTLVASFSKNVYLAELAVPFLTVILTLTCGVFAPPQEMPSTLYSKFFYNINPMRFTISSLVPNELFGLDVQCKAEEFIKIVAPLGHSCAQWMEPYTSRNGGYLFDPSAPTLCGYCPYDKGQEFYARFGMDFDNLGRDLGVIVIFVAFNVVATIIFTKVFRFSNR